MKKIYLGQNQNQNSRQGAVYTMTSHPLLLDSAVANLLHLLPDGSTPTHTRTAVGWAVLHTPPSPLPPDQETKGLRAESGADTELGSQMQTSTFFLLPL